jgi:hypothetical protein
MASKAELRGKSQPALRPRSVSILAGVQFLQGVALAGFGFYLNVIYGWPGVVLPPEPASQLAWAFRELTSGFGQMLFSLPVLFVSIALLRVARWAWMAAMALQGIGLMIALFAYALEQPNYLAMLLGVLLVFYLNQHEVQAAFRTRRGEM